LSRPYWLCVQQDAIRYRRASTVLLDGLAASRFYQPRWRPRLRQATPQRVVYLRPKLPYVEVITLVYQLYYSAS
jgi:hypothetical protein